MAWAEKAETTGGARLKAILGRDGTLLTVVLTAVAVYCGFYLHWLLTTHSLSVEGSSDWVGSDFFVYWAAAKYVLSGHAGSIYDLQAFTQYQLSIVDKTEGLFYPWPYPPHGLFAVLPFGLLPYTAAYALWCGLSFGFFAWVGHFGFAPQAPGARPPAGLVSAPRGATRSRACQASMSQAHRSLVVPLLALMIAPATIVNIVAGQNGFITGGLLMGGLLLMDRRPILAGILFGLLTFKPQMGLLIPVALIAARLWRPFIAAAMTGIAVAGLSALVFGIGAWRDFLDFLPVFQETVNRTEGAFTQFHPTVIMAAKIWGLPMTLGYALQGIVALIVACGVYLVYRKGTDRTTQAATLAFGLLLTTPYAFNYDMPAVALAVILVTVRGFETGFLRYEKLLLILGWLLPISVMQLNPMGMPIGPFVLMALFLTTAARALGAPATAPASEIKAAG